jgi:hypothetical protein
MNITFEDLRKIKHSLPHGSISRIAKELSRDEQEVRNYFGPLKFKGATADWHYEQGPNGGIVSLKDTTILDYANRILREAERS